MSRAMVDLISRHPSVHDAKAYLKFLVLVWLETWWCWQVLHNVKSLAVALINEPFRVMGRNSRHDRKNIQMREGFLKRRGSDLDGRRAMLLKSVIGGVGWWRRGTRAFFNGWEKERGVGGLVLPASEKISFNIFKPRFESSPPESHQEIKSGTVCHLCSTIQWIRECVIKYLISLSFLERWRQCQSR